MNSAGLFTAVFMLTLKTEVAAKDACSLTSDGTDMCQPASSTGTYNLASNNAQHVRDGSCNFGQGPCGYTQGCRQGMAPQWKHSAQGYFEMRATRSGGFWQTSVLESPVLDVSRPSCLSFTAFLALPGFLAVVLSTAQTNCTLLTRQSHPQGSNKSFAVELPLGVARLMFQGFNAGDTKHYARIYNVSVNEGCCQDPAWSSVVNHEGNNTDHPHCSWSITGMTITSLRAAVDTNARDGTVTTPLIRETPPGETDCLTFEYFLSNTDGSSLTVSIVGMHNVFQPLWTVRNQDNTGTGAMEYLKGQIPVSSSVAFKIQFTGRRNQMDSVVAIRMFLYQRGQASAAPCTFEPPEAAPEISAAAQENSNTGAIVGGVVIAVLIVLAIAIGGFIAWRRIQKKGDHHETDTHNSSDMASPLPNADALIGSPDNFNYERLNAVSEQRDYDVLQAPARQPTDSTYYELPSGERPEVTGTAGKNPNYQNIPVSENKLSITPNAATTKGAHQGSIDYLTPVMTMPVARDTTNRSPSGGDSSEYYLTPVTSLRASEESGRSQPDESSQPEYITIFA